MNLNKFKEIEFKKREKCVVCDSILINPLIELPCFPLTEIYVNKLVEKKLGFADQEFHFCSNCKHGQISNIISPEFLYGDKYATRTSTSNSAINGLNIFFKFINKNLQGKSIKNVLDVGCNDVYVLKRFKNYAERLYGVDPILKGKETEFNDGKITVIGDFLENLDFKSKGTYFDIVLCSHTLEHIEDPKKFMSKILDCSEEDALFFFQFPSLEPLVRTAHFDQVFHQHLNYFSIESFKYFLDMIGAKLVDFEVNDDHWGTLMVCFKKTTSENSSKNISKSELLTAKNIIEKYELFKKSMNLTNERLKSFKNETIYGYGAALMIPVLHYYVPELVSLKKIIDDDPNKEGLYYLNTPLQITQSKNITSIKDKVIFITATTSKQAIRGITKKLIEQNVKDIIIPMDLI